MKFFLPGAEDSGLAERSYQAIKKYIEEQTGLPMSDARYYEIHYNRHNGEDLHARVGALDAKGGEMVMAIFKPRDYVHGPYLVCTKNRGVAQGAPIMASGGGKAIEFDSLPGKHHR